MRRPIIIDTDPGIDDALAIAIALFSEELDVVRSRLWQEMFHWST